MSLVSVLQSFLLLSGAGFFFIGTLGLLRFPDAYTRVHALTKVDNLGLGLVVLGLLPSAPSLVVAIKLLLIWILTLAASATAGHLVANGKFYRHAPQQDKQNPEANPVRHNRGSAGDPSGRGDR